MISSSKAKITFAFAYEFKLFPRLFPCFLDLGFYSTSGQGETYPIVYKSHFSYSIPHHGEGKKASVIQNLGLWNG